MLAAADNSAFVVPGQAMLKSLRALYADTEPALVNDTGEQVAKRFRVRACCRCRAWWCCAGHTAAPRRCRGLLGCWQPYKATLLCAGPSAEGG